MPVRIRHTQVGYDEIIVGVLKFPQRLGSVVRFVAQEAFTEEPADEQRTDVLLIIDD
jgi:hypothetical protein